MAFESLEQFVGGSQSQRQDYSDFLRRFQQDPNSISADEASQRYRELLRNASPGAVSEAYEHILGQVAPEQRRQLAEQFQSAHENPRSAFNGFRFSSASQAADAGTLGRMAFQAEQQDPDLLAQILGKDSPLNSTLGRLALAGIAAYLAHRAMGPQSGQPAGQPTGQASQSQGLPGGLGALGALGGLIGVLSHAQQSGGQSAGGLGGLLDALGGGQSQQQSGGAGGLGGLGGLLDALSRGQGQQQSGGAGGLGGLGGLLDALGGGQGQASQSQGLPGGLGGLLDALGGGQGQASQSQGLPGGLGGLLDALGGGQAPADTTPPAPAPAPQDGGTGLHVKGSKKNRG